MKRSSTVIAAATALAATTIAVAAGVPAARADAGPAGPAMASGAAATLAGSTVPFAAAHNALGAVPASSRLTIELWLKPQTAAAESYATAVSTPGSPLFEHYLSPAAYTARFGATAQEASLRRVVAQVGGLHRRLGRLRPGLRAGHRGGVNDRRGAEGPARLLPVKRQRQRRPVPAARQRPARLAAGVGGRRRARGHRPGQRRAGADVQQADRGTAADDVVWGGGQADRVPLLAVVRPALREPPAQAVRHHQLPDHPLRLLRRPAPRCLRVQPAQHRQGRDHRAGRGRPDPGHVPDPAGLRQGRPHRVPVAEPVRRALARPGDRPAATRSTSRSSSTSNRRT